MAKRIGNSIFITGAASGIGQSTARQFANRGWRVGLVDRNAAALDALVGELGSCACGFTVDVLDGPSLQAALEAFATPSGAIKALFNSAGLLEMRPFTETPVARLHEILDVNVKGVVNAIQAALPFLKADDDARIVTMGSASGIYGIPELAVYSASKFAVRALTEALNIELEQDGIWVADIMVGYVKTPMIEKATRKAKSVEIVGVNVTPEMVAEAVWTAMSEKKVHWFVPDGDAEGARQVDFMPWESRRDFFKAATGY